MQKQAVDIDMNVWRPINEGYRGVGLRRHVGPNEAAPGCGGVQ